MPWTTPLAGRSNVKVKDPVCGMKIEDRDAKYRSDYQGTFYYFCGPDCKIAFDQDPERYLTAGAASKR